MAQTPPPGSANSDTLKLLGVPVSPPESPPLSRATLTWVFSTYFAQGFPFVVVRILSGVFFTDVGVKERFLGYLNFLNVPWNFKFLWAPLVDAYGTKRGWLVAMQAILTVLLLAISVLCGVAVLQPDPAFLLKWIALLFVVMAIVAATNDIAIDAFYMEGITERRTQAAYSGHRVLAYRVAMVYARSGLVAFAAYIATASGSDNPYRPWCYAFGAGALTLAITVFYHWWSLPYFQQRASRPSLAEASATFRNAFLSYLAQDKIVLILLFVIFYKVGDEVLFSMVTPFLLRELAITKTQYAFASGVVGAVGSVVGAMWGGLWIKRIGLRRAIMPLTLIMNLSIWFYIVLAWSKPPATELWGITVINAVHFVEQVAAGLGSAALLVYLLGTCKVEFKAAHYAIGSALMSVPATVFGGYSGWYVEKYGYVSLFILAFILSLPTLILIKVVPFNEEK